MRPDDVFLVIKCMQQRNRSALIFYLMHRQKQNLKATRAGNFFLINFSLTALMNLVLYKKSVLLSSVGLNVMT